MWNHFVVKKAYETFPTINSVFCGKKKPVKEKFKIKSILSSLLSCYINSNLVKTN
jgi:hypothetical protein